jgi:hypothetical protein
MSDRIDNLTERIEKLSVELSEGLAEQREYTESAYSNLGQNIDTLRAEVGTGFSRLERKLDQFIDTQIRTNQIVDRRLRLVEE